MYSKRKTYKVAEKRKKLVKKQKWRCYFCNIKFNEADHFKKSTLDHLTPYCQVWNNTKYAAVCHRCNLLKWACNEQEYRDWYSWVCIKTWYNLQSYSKALKIRQPIKWFQKLFPSIFWWNNWKKIITIKLYE